MLKVTGAAGIIWWSKENNKKKRKEKKNSTKCIQQNIKITSIEHQIIKQ